MTRKVDGADIALYVFALAAVIVFSATGAYVGGRIVLPEIGLVAPAWSTWFWAAFWGFLLALPGALINSMIKAD